MTKIPPTERAQVFYVTLVEQQSTPGWRHPRTGEPHGAGWFFVWAGVPFGPYMSRADAVSGACTMGLIV